MYGLPLHAKPLLADEPHNLKVASDDAPDIPRKSSHGHMCLLTLMRSRSEDSGGIRLQKRLAEYGISSELTMCDTRSMLLVMIMRSLPLHI